MSQVVRISDVKIEGFVYLGEERWSRSSEEIMNWLCDGWRFRYNHHRSWRIEGTETWEGSDAEARSAFEHLSALPAMVLQSTGRLENEEWFSGLKRIKTNGQNGRTRGSAPRFKRRSRGRSFACWYNSGSNAKVQVLSKRRAELLITGQNPSGRYGPGNTLRWRVRIRFRLSQAIRPYTSVRVNWTARSISFVNAPLPIQREPTGSMVGIDLGITHTATDSNGTFADIPKASPSEERRYKSLQRKLARQDRVNQARGGKPVVYRSRRRQRTLQSMNTLASKQSRRRKNWVEQVTTQLVKEHDLIVLEDLKPQAMSAAGGARKRGLNRGIQESCWGLLRSRLETKAALSGVQVEFINPAYTSQCCNNCGYIDRDNRENQAIFRCKECTHSTNADINAANNILDLYLGRWTNQESGLDKPSDGEEPASATATAVVSGTCEPSIPELLEV